MATQTTHRVNWTLILSDRGFRYFFVAMFVSLFGSGMNFAGVGWYILAATHSPVKVSLQVVVVTLPGLLVPFLGGVLIDRFDRRYLGIALDLARGVAVLATAAIAYSGRLEIWHLYAMTLVTGMGFAMYWATVNALVQEVIPPGQFLGANAAVLIGVQSGMLLAGSAVGFVYDRAGIAGILAIDGATYFVSAFCLAQLRRGYVSPRQTQRYPHEFSEATEATAEALETSEMPAVAEAGLALSVYSDLREGFAYLRKQAQVRALGLTHSTMMAGVVSANVLLVLLASEVLHAGARGLGFLEGGWAFGAICGGLIASQLPPRIRLTLYVAAMAGLAAGHAVMPLVTFLLGAVLLQATFGFFRALGGVVAQSSLMAIVPRHFMGRTQSAFAILTTALQLLMSICFGWLTEREGVLAGFALLSGIYAVATLAAYRARSLANRSQNADSVPL
jgi:MFS transporter, DHA3 family, macrolide efflux protein